MSADTLSRVTLGDAWTTHPDIIRELDVLSGGITIDRFATRHNRVVATYNSFFMEEGSAGTDAFAQLDYDLHTNYIHPPIGIVGRVL